jgi:hypothetical protein
MVAEPRLGYRRGGGRLAGASKPFATVVAVLIWLGASGCDSCSCGSEHEPKPDAEASRSPEVVEVVARRDAGEPPDVIDEKEPNNFAGDALELPPGKGARGYIGKPYGPNNDPDRDFYRITVPKGGKKNLWARLSGVPGLRIALEIREAKNFERLTVAAAAKPGRGVTLTNLALEPGVYYLRVRELWTGKSRHHNLKNPYILRWRLTEIGAGDEVEPNDEIHKASFMEAGQKATGYLSRPGDRDYYKVGFGKLDEDARLRVLVSSLSGVRMEVVLYDGAMRQLVERKAKRGRPLSFRNLELPHVRDHFYVQVRAVEGLNDREPYTLRVEPDASGGGVEREPNDLVRLAMRLEGRRGSVQGILESKQDKDTFRIDVVRSATLQLRVKPQKDLDIEVLLLDRAGRLLAKADAGKSGYVEVFPNMRLRPGETWIRVQASKGRVARTSKYALRWRLLGVEKGDEIEPNDKMGNATGLVAGQSARGFIYPPGDVDYYRFRLRGRPSTTGRVRIVAQGIPKVKLELSLLDGVRNVLKQAQQRSFAGPRTIEVNLHVGKWYYVRVRDAENRRSNAADSYELEVVRKW